MNSNSVRDVLLWFAGFVIVLNYCVSAVEAAEPFVISSPAFKDGTLMPKKSSNNTPGSANCVGENISPALIGPIRRPGLRATR